MENENIDDAGLKRLGIERVPTPVYLRGGCRFGNLREGVPATRRGGAR